MICYDCYKESARHAVAPMTAVVSLVNSYAVKWNTHSCKCCGMVPISSKKLMPPHETTTVKAKSINTNHKSSWRTNCPPKSCKTCKK